MHLTAYHIKEEFAKECGDSFESLMRDLGVENLEIIDTSGELPFVSRLFLFKQEPNPPSWVKFLRGVFGGIEGVMAQSPRAVLFVKITVEGKDEVFAFTFGHGRYMLMADSYNENYGLRVALNAIYEQLEGKDPINPNRIRSLSAQTLADNPIRTKRQVDRKATFWTFGVDIQRDLLNAVTGIPMRSRTWGTRISGSDSLSANPNIEFAGLGGYCEKIVDTYKDETFKRDFDFIENLRVVSDTKRKASLGKGLVERIIKDAKSTTRDAQSISLAVPEVIDFEKVDHFCFSLYASEEDAQDRTEGKVQTGETFYDTGDVGLDILKGFGALKDERPDSKKLLKDITERWYMEAFADKDQNELLHSWPILKCLSFTTTSGKKTYVLSDGHFFEIDSSFIKELDSYIEELETTVPCPPKCDKGTEEEKYGEGKYNENAACDDSPFLLMDKKLVSIQDDEDNTTTIEPCDLYTCAPYAKKGCFVHVKKNHGSSALSHLFAQGSTSAALFLRNEDYRLKVRQRMEAEEEKRAVATGDQSFIKRFSNFKVDSVDPSKFEVSYAIIDEWNGKGFESLPLFSKVTLRKNVDDLRRMGYGVSIARINYK